MEILNKLFEKRIKMRPWLTAGAICILISIIALLVITPFLATTNITWIILPFFAFMAIGLIPYGMTDRIDAKISKALAEEVKSNILDVMKSKSFVLEAGMQFEIRSKRIDGAYLLEVFSQNVSVDFLALALKLSIQKVQEELKYSPHIESTIFQKL